MAVDPKYIENVRNEEEFEDILSEFGIQGHYEQTGNGLDLDGYMQTTLREMYPNDECIGRPILSDIYTTEFKNKTTGETIVNHKIDLVLLDDTYEDEKEAYIFPINLNSDNIDNDKKIVKNVHSASGLYALAMGLMELRAKGISRTMNVLDVVGINSLQKQVKNYSSLTIKIIEKKMVDRKTKEEKYYNAFRIIEGE